MKPLDRFLQAWRIHIARDWVRPNDRLLDVGCFGGEFLRTLGDTIAPSIGLEPTLMHPSPELAPHHLVNATFPHHGLSPESFDAISMLAVMEHVPAEDLDACATQCYDLLRPGGRVIITVPSPLVDTLLRILHFFRLIEGMSVEQHYGFLPARVYELFRAPQFKLLCHRRFQLGLNNLFVFEKSLENVKR